MEVRAYSYGAKAGSRDAIIEDGKLNPSVINTNGALLATNQVKRLLAAVTGDHPQHYAAGCFNPRHAFVFYDSDKKPIAQLEICFECLHYRANPEGTAVFVDWLALADLCRELKLPNSPNPEFSERFKRWTDRNPKAQQEH